MNARSVAPGPQGERRKQHLILRSVRSDTQNDAILGICWTARTQDQSLNTLLSSRKVHDCLASSCHSSPSACTTTVASADCRSVSSQQDNSGIGRVLLKSVKIETIETENAGVGWCVSSLFSPRRGFENWAQSAFNAGFSQLYVYYATVKDQTALSQHYDTSKVHGDFTPETLPNVHYFYFEPPVHTWLFAQTTMANECIHRNRLKHRFLAVADTDEFFWRQPSQDSLEAFLDSVMPVQTASLIFPAIMYPEPCQENRSYAVGVDPLLDSHFYYPTKAGTQPKSIIVPARSLVHRVHTLARPEPTFECCKEMPPSTAYWKHVRQHGGRCGHQRQYLADDRNASSFHATMHNTSMWVPA